MGKEIKQFNPFDKELAEFKEKYEGVVYDFTVKKNEKQARSDRFAIGKVVSALDAVHKELKAPLLEKTKLLDSHRKEIKDGLLEIQGDIKAQIEKHEKIEKDRVAAIQDRIDAIKHPAMTFSALNDTKEIKTALDWVESVRIDDSFAEFQQEALFTKMDAAMALQKVYDERLEIDRVANERAKERRELEEKGRKERDEQIAEQARLDAEEAAAKQISDALTAKKQAEDAAAKAAEKATVDAAQAIIDREAAVQKAKDDAAAETKRVEEKKAFEENLERLAQKRRQEDIDVRLTIEGRVIDGLVSQGLSLMDAKIVIDAVKGNHTPDMTINY
jgi:colicin import membrane protein